MDDRWVLLDEMTESDDLGPVALGVFMGSLFVGEESMPAHVEGLSLDDALIWGRNRASIVKVRLSGFDAATYSAGSRPTSEPPIDTAASIVRRRPAGWEFLDRTEAHDPIPWDVVVDADREILTAMDENDKERWRDTVNAASKCEVSALREHTATPPMEGSPGAWTAYAHESLAVLRIEARTAEAGIGIAIAASRQAASQLGFEADPGFRVTGVYAAGSRAACANLRHVFGPA